MDLKEIKKSFETSRKASAMVLSLIEHVETIQVAITDIKGRATADRMYFMSIMDAGGFNCGEMTLTKTDYIKTLRMTLKHAEAELEKALEDNFHIAV
jgi:hypothetical protein